MDVNEQNIPMLSECVEEKEKEESTLKSETDYEISKVRNGRSVHSNILHQICSRAALFQRNRVVHFTCF